MINVVVADDHPIFLSGLCDLIQTQADLRVVAAVETGELAVEEVKRQKPEMLISDISMPGISGIEASRQARNYCPDIKILILSMHAERHHVLAALDAGANGYMLKESARDELVRAMRSLALDKAYLSPAIAGHVVEAICKGKPKTDDVLSQLTARELEVLRLISRGNSTKQVACDLGISPKTVATHREHLMKKLDLHSAAALTRFAIRKGLDTTN